MRTGNNIRSIMVDKTGYLKWEEIEKVILAAKNNRDRVLLMTMAYTGRRISEILPITPRNILWDEESGIFTILKKHKLKRKELDGTITIIDRKPDEQVLPINTTLLSVLKKYIAINNIKEDERLFDITRKRVYQIVRKAGFDAGYKRVGRKWIHPHTFRHSFAIAYYKKTHDINRLSQLLKHADVNMTMTYSQFSQKDLREGLDDL